MKRKHNGWNIMLIERPPKEECKLMTLRPRLGKGKKIWAMLQRNHWEPKCLKNILGYDECYQRQSKQSYIFLEWGGWGRPRREWRHRAWKSWGKMLNLAGWLAQSAKRYSTAWNVAGQRGRGLSHWCNHNGGMQPITFMREICSMVRPNWWFQYLGSLNHIGQLPHHYRWHVKNYSRLSQLSKANCRCLRGPHNPDVVESGKVPRPQTHIPT